MIISIVNHKSGVGKTAITTNLSYELSTTGKKILTVDLDPQGHTTTFYCASVDLDNNVSNVIKERGYEIKNAIVPALISNDESSNLFILPATLELEETGVDIFGRTRFEKLLFRQLEKIENLYDYILVDCPPNLGPLTQNGLFAANFIIIPIDYDVDALRGVKSIIRKINDVKEDQENYSFKVLRNLYDKRNKTIVNKIDSLLADNIPKEYQLKTILRSAAVLKNSRSAKEPIAVYDPKSKLTEDFKNLSDEIEQLFAVTEPQNSEK